MNRFSCTCIPSHVFISTEARSTQKFNYLINKTLLLISQSALFNKIMSNRRNTRNAIEFLFVCFLQFINNVTNEIGSQLVCLYI